MQLVEVARGSVLPDWKCQSIVPNAQNDRLWRIIIVHLATLERQSTNDSSLYSQSSRKKVERKGDTLSKTCKDAINNSFVKDPDKHRYLTRQNPGRFWNPCWTHFLGLERGPVRVREHVWSPYFSRCQKSSTVSDEHANQCLTRQGFHTLVLVNHTQGKP